jgi:AbrB family looped-hinge helix DNA binding protein
MCTATLSSKGQLVIPLELRRMLGLRAGDRFVCAVDRKFPPSLMRRQLSTRRFERF